MISNAIELRESSDGENWQLNGYASTWNAPYKMGYDPVMKRPQRHVEIMAPHSFPGAVDGTDVVALRVEHADGAPPLASTRGGSLHFTDDSTGLLLTAILPKGETDVADAVSKVKRGVLSELSVGMSIPKGGDQWSDDRTRRTIKKARLAEVSLVHLAANPAARVLGVRGETDEYEVRYVGSLAVVETRRDFTDAEKAALGKEGKAVYFDGGWHFPTPTRTDYDNAVLALGRTPGKNRALVRRYLIGRAKAEGWPIPPSWNSDGTIKRSLRKMSDAEIRARVLVGRPMAPPSVEKSWTMLRLQAERMARR